jgi:glutamine cyclotransferase
VVRALLAAALLAVAGCGVAAPTTPAPAAPVSAPTSAPAPVPTLHPEVLAELPHDPSAFTQGFEIDDGILYEGTGLEGRSQLRELDPETGAVRRSVALPGALFGEGITVVGDRIWQLTWRDGVVLEWDRATLTLRQEVPIQGGAGTVQRRHPAGPQRRHGPPAPTTPPPSRSWARSP